jgi:signal transduction histidine kinase
MDIGEPFGHLTEARVPAWAWDLVLAVLVSMALALIIATAPGGVGDAEPFAFVFAVGLGALMLLRRRLPRAVLVLSSLGVFAYYTLDYPPIGIAVPLFAALFSAAEAGLLAWPILTALVVYAVSTLFRLRDGDEAVGTLLGYESVSNLALFAAAIAIGVTLRARRIATAQRARIAALTAAQVSRETDVRVEEERARISRDLHDSVGHALSVIALHASVASEQIGTDDGAAATAVQRIREASLASLAELRSMVRLLRAATDDERPVVLSLAGVDDLLDAARATGLRVHADVQTDTDLPPSVQAAGYRVIQEALTNVIRHANATEARVTGTVHDSLFVLVVEDDGRDNVAAREPGTGLVGMSERVRLLGGALMTSKSATGFRLEARIPTRLGA